MRSRVSAPAERAPALTGLDTRWSRLVTTSDPSGAPRTWHVLDSANGRQSSESELTILCVHGNPTWSYLWRSLLTELGDRYRVVAVDHLGMGFSEHTSEVHRLADRIAELACVTSALKINGPVVTVGHDWGGSISLGWAADHRAQLAGIVLTNTALGQPPGVRVPPLLQSVRFPLVTATATARTSLFVDGTLRLAHPPLTRDVKRAYRAPYVTSARRDSVRDFVDDIPLDIDHPSYQTLTDVQAALEKLVDAPTLLLWGTRDPVFGERYLLDALRRLPRANVQRYPAAGHLVMEDAPVSRAIAAFVDEVSAPTSRARQVSLPLASAESVDSSQPLWHHLDERADDQTPAMLEIHDGKTQTTSWHTLSRRVTDFAEGLTAFGVKSGDRVGMLVPPGVDLTVAVYAAWRIGAVVVVADAGLGLTGLRRALAGARLDVVVAGGRGVIAAAAMRLPVRVITTTEPQRAVSVVARPATTMAAVENAGRQLRQRGDSRSATVPTADDFAAVLFTSGATGPAKGVAYRHRQLNAQRDAISELLLIERSDALVAAFAPFALYGPALGIPSVVPDMDVTAPGTLTAAALREAIDAVDATLVFSSPAALRNVVASSLEVEPPHTVRELVSAGAPVSRKTLRLAAELLGSPTAHTPYGMTEALPISDITLDWLDELGDGNGVCVGRSVSQATIAIDPLLPDGTPTATLTTDANITGEIVVSGPHIMDHYDQLWLTERTRSRFQGWHRTGDVGHLDPAGRLWVEGRLAHIIVTAQGVVTPVGIEQRLEQHLTTVTGLGLVAVVGVGPRGTQQLVAICQSDTVGKPRQAHLDELDEIRALSEHPVAAAFVVERLPVDVRHNSKIDRENLARWADTVLSGHPAGNP